MINVSELKLLIKQQAPGLFAGSLEKLKDAAIGEPVPMKDIHELQQYWFTPLLSGDKISGLIIHDLFGKIIINGSVTPHAADEKKIDKKYLEAPPGKMINEIKRSYPRLTIIKQFFSFDRVPQKWAWQLKLADNKDEQVIIFISSAGWYEKKESNTDREG